jgi:hypothetical protein
MSLSALQNTTERAGSIFTLPCHKLWSLVAFNPKRLRCDIVCTVVISVVMYDIGGQKRVK